MSGGNGGSERPYTVGSFQAKLDQFQELMKEITLQDVEATPEEKRQMITENLRYDQFCDAIRQLFGSDIKNHDLKTLYRKISTNPDAKIDWSELFGYIQTTAEEAEEIMVGEEVSIFTVSKRRRVGEAAGDKKRRDAVQCIKYVPTLDSYISCSQKGALAIWSNKLRLQSCIDINEAAWVTGCDYLSTIRRASCCTERSIIIWDNRSKGKNQHVFAIKPFDHSPQCMVSIPKPGVIHEDRILFGDDQGYINILTIAAKDLTMKNSKGSEKKPAKDQNVLHVIEPNKLTVPMVCRKVHDDWVTKVKYFPELHCFASCSPSGKLSFVLEEIDRIYDNGELRGVAVHKGVNAFDYCAKANIIATGGVDKVIRVWHPHIFSRPTGKLLGHLFTIVDICCNERDQHIISLSTARVFRVWDIHTLTSLQVFTDNEERPGEKRIYSMLFDNKHERLLTGSSVIDSWPLTRAVQDTMQVPHTHDRPLSQLVFNKDLGQIVTVCTESVLKVWEMESGKLVYTLTDVHKNNIEITALTLDSSGYRLASGAFDGSIKIWDFGSGQCIKEKQGRASDEDLSITGLVYSKLEEDRVLIASGWNNKLKVLLDTNDNYDLPIIREFNDIYYYTQDIAVSMVTSSYDPFRQQDPLPDIGQESRSSGPSSLKSHSEKEVAAPSINRPRAVRGQSNAQISNVFKKEYILTLNELSCMTSFGANSLLTGCTNGSIIQWNIEKSCVDKVFHLPESDQPNSNSRSQTRNVTKTNDKRIHCIKTLVHKTRRLDPASIKKETTFQESLKVEDEPDKGTAAHHSKTGTPVQSDEESKEKHEKESPEKQTKDKEAHTDEGSSSSGDDEEEEKKDEEKSIYEEEEDPEVVRERENAAKYIVDTYDPIIVTVHQDSFVRFWNTEGHVLREISAVTRREGTAVTALCHDADCNIIVTGDHKGYLTLWDIGKFLRDPESEDQELVKQVICWRAHLTKVVSLTYIDSVKAILSASTDGSARVWWGRKGRFVGFFGQHRTFNFPISEEKAGPATLPYDITEGPLAPLKTKSAIQKIRPVQKYEYPLIFDEDRWLPFRRSSNIQQSQDKKKLDPHDMKFFEALIKPKAYNYHLEGVAPGRKRDGAVFRALPVYRVRTPEVPKTPPISFRTQVDVSEGSQAKHLIAQQPNTRTDKPGMTINSNTPRLSTTIHHQPRMQKLYIHMQDKQKSKGSKEGSSTSFPLGRRRSVFGKSSSVGTPILSVIPAITTTLSSPTR